MHKNKIKNTNIYEDNIKNKLKIHYNCLYSRGETVQNADNADNNYFL